MFWNHMWWSAQWRALCMCVFFRSILVVNNIWKDTPKTSLICKEMTLKVIRLSIMRVVSIWQCPYQNHFPFSTSLLGCPSSGLFHCFCTCEINNPLPRDLHSDSMRLDSPWRSFVLHITVYFFTAAQVAQVAQPMLYPNRSDNLAAIKIYSPRYLLLLATVITHHNTTEGTVLQTILKDPVQTD